MKVRKGILALILIASLGACADSPLAPDMQPQRTETGDNPCQPGYAPDANGVCQKGILLGGGK